MGLKMNREQIEIKIKEIVALQFGKKLDDIKMETKFIEDLHTDSLDTIELIMGIEDRFDMGISEEQAEILIKN